MLAALASPERLRIVRFLREGPRNVTEVAEMLGTPVVNASHHLTVLRNAKLVRSQRQGRFMLYSLPPSVFRPGEEGPGEMQQINLGCCRIELPRQEE